MNDSPLRILYVGSLGAYDSSTYRRDALTRLGHDVTSLDVAPFLAKGGRVQRAIRIRTLIGPSIDRLNREVLHRARQDRPQLVWFDKAVFIQPDTIAKLREDGAFCLQYCVDNPFGPRRDPGWRLLRKALPLYDLHLVPRSSNVEAFRQAGARDVRMLHFAYEPNIHFPPPAGWSDKDRDIDVIFIGAPYDGRLEFLTGLRNDEKIPLRLWGAPVWRKLAPDLYEGSPLFGDDYRNALWRAKICLSFVTHSNCDEVAHKSFEITACGAFLLAEDTPGHRQHFAADKEAVFFTSRQDCAEKIRRFLPDEASRAAIAAAGCRRSHEDGYGNDARIAAIIDYLRQAPAFRDREEP